MHAPSSPPPAPAPSAAPAAHDLASTLTLSQRLKRLSPYFGGQRLAWTMAVAATLVGAAITLGLSVLAARGVGQRTRQA